MIDLHDIRYLRIGTPDLDGAIKFATEIVGLQLSAREGQDRLFPLRQGRGQGRPRAITRWFISRATPPTRRSGLISSIPTISIGRRLHSRPPAIPSISEHPRNASAAASRPSSLPTIPAANRIEIVGAALSFGRALLRGARRRHHPFQPYRPLHARCAARREILDHAVQRAGVRLDRRGRRCCGSPPRIIRWRFFRPRARASSTSIIRSKMSTT